MKKVWVSLIGLVVVSSWSLLGWSHTYRVNRLTNSGVEEIKIQEPKVSKLATNLANENSILALSVSKKSKVITESKWPNLGAKQSLKIVVIGDSGCRLKEGKSKEYQNCQNWNDWPFPKIMKQVEKENPDLVIHLGDYHYREQCTKGMPCEKMSSEVGYGWEPWRQDFFEPASLALKRAPWIFARGNHEDCKRAFLGYSRTISSIDMSAGCVDYEPPSFIQFKDLLIVNVDTSTISDAIEASSEVENVWLARFKEIEDRIAEILKKQPGKSVWIVTHKPVYGLVKFGEGFASTNVNLKKYFEASPLRSRIHMLLAGHIHVSQILKVKTAPIQFVLGNGGTQLDMFQDSIEKAGATSLGYDFIKSGSPGFGYAVFSRKKNNWKVAFKNQDGKLESQCSIAAGFDSCK